MVLRAVLQQQVDVRVVVLGLHEALEGSAWQRTAVVCCEWGEKSRFLIMTLNKFMDVLIILKNYGDW